MLNRRMPKPIDLYLPDLRHPDAKVRRAAVKGLRQSRNPAALPHLIAALDDGSFGVIFHAVRGLEALGDPAAIPPLIAMLERDRSCDVCDEIGAALTEFGDAAVGPLIDALRSPSPRARSIAARCLGQIGDPLAVPGLIALLDDPHPWPLSAALAALWRFKDVRAADPLAAFLTRSEDAIPADEITSPYAQKRAAAYALAELGDPRAIDTLADAYTRDRGSCVTTIQQLGKIHDPRVRPLIERYLDADPQTLCASQARATLEHLAF